MTPPPAQDGMPLPLCEAHAIDTRSEWLVNLMRLLLALAAVLIAANGTAEAVPATIASHLPPVLYLAFSLTICFAHRTSPATGKPLLPGIRTIANYAPWADIVFYATLVALGNPVFYVGFFFALLAASSRWRFASVLRFGFTAAIIFISLNYLSPFAGATPGTGELLPGAAVLLAVGVVAAYQAGSGIMLQRRLTLLCNVTKLSNPRFGIDHTLGSLLNELRAFYDADTCLIVAQVHDAAAEFGVRRATRAQPEQAERVEPLAAPVANLLLSPPHEDAFVYHDAGLLRRLLRRRLTTVRIADGICVLADEADQSLMRSLAAALDAESFISVPMQPRHGWAGRLYIASSRPAAFELSDAIFVMQVLGQLIPLIENIRLVDRLASNAAEEERRKIARDLHDSVIQPFIGIKLGLQAVRQSIAPENAEAAALVEHLTKMIDAEINDMRSYVGGLSKQEKPTPNLLPAMRRFASKFSEATGIAVDVHADADLGVNDRLAAEAFQIMSEGLSNVRRHTQARRASVGLCRRNGSLVLSIENDGAPLATTAAPFTPRSITERARALGGQVNIECTGADRTLVEVEIPF